MTGLRKAAEQALEALCTCGQQQKEAKEALRQALDKPEIDPQALVEMAVLAEREACAKLLDDMAAKDKLSNYYAVAARAIRANRSQTATSAFISNRSEK